MTRNVKMFLAWFHVPVTATEWLWERYGICKALSTSVTMTNPGQNFFYDIVARSIRHHNHQLQWHHTDNQYQYSKVWTELSAVNVKTVQLTNNDITLQNTRGQINKKSYAELMPNLGQMLDIRKTWDISPINKKYYEKLMPNFWQTCAKVMQRWVSRV